MKITMIKYGFAFFLMVFYPIGCAHLPIQNDKKSLEIYKNPAIYVGKTVEVCGIIGFEFENRNIWLNKKARYDDELGLGVAVSHADAERVLQSLHGKRSCLAGEIIRSGCGVEKICTATNFEYQIVVQQP